MRNALFVAAFAVLGTGLAQAQVIWDDTGITSGTTFRSTTSGAPALHITNTNASNVTLSNVAFSGQNTAQQDFLFFLADNSGNILSSVTVNEGASGAHAIIGANVNWTLNANTTYFIGAMMSTSNCNYDYDTTGLLQNGLQGLVSNGNFLGYPNPVFQGTAGAEMSWRLSAVPEPTSILVIGSGIAAILARRRRARK